MLQIQPESQPQNKRPPNILSPNCLSRQALEILADKWVVLVIKSLSLGNRRNGEIMRSISDISQKMLTQTLRNLEYSGFIEREIFREVPPRVEYQLTELGHSLYGLIKQITEWAETHFEDIISARQIHDSTKPNSDE